MLTQWLFEPDAGALPISRPVFTNSALIGREDRNQVTPHFTSATRRLHREPELPFPSARCENALMSSVSVKNCIKFYTTADDIGAGTLKDYCSRLISTHWVGQGKLG